MTTEIINIGDELLNGTAVNTNATWLCGQMAEYGAKTVAVTMVGDDIAEILRTFDVAATRADFIVVTGGLGPTSDDRTKEATLQYFGGRLVPNEQEIDRIKQMFAKRGLPLTERNIEQGYVPDNCVVHSNSAGTAPGMEFSKEGKTWLFLPGVPFEMKSIFTENLHRWFGSTSTEKTFVTREIMVIGIGESFVADAIRTWQESLPEWLSLAYLPSAGLLRIRLSCFHKDHEFARDHIGQLLQQVMKLFPGNAFFTDGMEWNQYFFSVFQRQGLTVSTAESCTGGYLSHRITSVPGSSEIFRGGMVAYHNDIKSGWLAVPEKVLEEHGAVSEEVVALMAQNIRTRFGTSLGIAVSGIAGPDGGSDAKPVGTVWIAVADAQGVDTKMFLMGTDRIRNIEKSAVVAMKMALNRVAIAP